MELRKAVPLKDGIDLSIQASGIHYSTPRVDGWRLRDYTAVELGLLGPEKERSLFGSIKKVRLCRPSDIGVEGFDHLFESGDCPVAGYVSWDDVKALIKAIRSK